MSTNSNKDKSKIDKIREDLEKKLASLESARLDKKENRENKEKQEVKGDESNETAIQNVEINESENKATENDSVSENSSFLDQISNIENETKPEETVKDSTKDENEVSDEVDETIFEISDKIEVVQKEEQGNEKENLVVPPVLDKEEQIDFNKIENNLSSISGNSLDDIGDEIEEIETSELEEAEEKSSNKLSFLIYGLLGLLVLVVGYFVLDYLKGKEKLNSDITSKKIIELENRRYQDSIRLLDAEKRLAEFESQRYIDSIAEADRLKLTVVDDNSDIINNKAQPKKVKKTKPTTTIYKNNKPVATSNSNVNFDKIATSDKKENTNTNIIAPDQSSIKPDNSQIQELKDDKDKEIVKQVKKEKKIETLNTIEKAPVYPGCENKKTERARKTCMISKINSFVNKNFNTYIAQDLGFGSGLQRINVSFIIDKNGYANVLRTRAKHEKLKKEAVRVINKLPRMKPAMKDGKKTQIVYNLPIIFSIEQ
jgi:hypothetical protein